MSHASSTTTRPVAREARERPQAPAHPLVLVVDDDDDVRLTLCEVLKDDGYAVEESPNGADALARLKAGPLPSVVLLDMMMPVMDGWQFLRARRDDPRLAEIPVVLLTASSAEDVPNEDVRAYLRKPVDLAELLGTVKGPAG